MKAKFKFNSNLCPLSVSDEGGVLKGRTYLIWMDDEWMDLIVYAAA